MRLTGQQIEIIRLTIDQSRIDIQTLQDDLVDHLCCVVEDKINNHKEFDAALREALHELAPDGLDQIQRETLYLLNFNKTLFMKKVTYFIGLIATVSMSLGFTFLIFDWNGGLEMLIYGLLGFVLIFIPMIAIDNLKVSLLGTMSEKLRIIIGTSSGVVVGLGIILKYLNVQGADQLLFGGTLLFSFGFLPFLFFNIYKKSVS